MESISSTEDADSALDWLALLIQTDAGEGHLHNIIKENTNHTTADFDFVKAFHLVPAVFSYSPLFLEEQTKPKAPHFFEDHHGSRFIVQSNLLRGPPALV